MRRFWPDQRPLGQRLSVSGRTGPFLEVVGVAKNAKYNSLREDPLPFIYLPVEQRYSSGLTLYVRTAGDPSKLFSIVRNEVQALDHDLPLFRLLTMNEHLGIALIEQRIAAVLLGIFGLLALILASVGLYGVMSYFVSQRTRELGIRMALGAQSGTILKLSMKQCLVPTVIGLTIRFTISIALAQLISAQLYGVSATSLVVYALASSVLTIVALLAGFIPALRATKTNPLVALRYQ